MVFSGLQKYTFTNYRQNLLNPRFQNAVLCHRTCRQASHRQQRLHSASVSSHAMLCECHRSSPAAEPAVYRTSHHVSSPQQFLPLAADGCWYRVDKSRSQKTGGTGLGLAIVKHICALYGAEISINSEIDVGTEFVIVFKKDKK